MMRDTEFKAMQAFMAFVDHVHPYVPARAQAFGVQPGMTVVDYGCGPGRYTTEFARLVGDEGVVYAVDLLDIALEQTGKRLEKMGVCNVNLVKADGYDTGIPDGAADMVFAIDMIHHIDDIPALLREIWRISTPDASLVFSGGHMSRRAVKTKVSVGGGWQLAEEHKHFLRYEKLEVEV